ncbi:MULTISPECIES: flagellar motor switch phosphatase FliY [unclassified Sporosarcina]|uniref:flagellar motor switch phosphatase FliY n=1 Tax=unclassified Sporosarcina TaxID=2647733 RepID=UPI000C163DB4|nr:MULTISPECIES: flagellar motor switch phosphatase FliY [unclassified Sporosarcina]PID00291.1 flagellar motor switch phosphatase FliY [Sporosarcina sp. P29]PID07001.1 flagellar motor switch phosphatase FliY [Sporosarcina sp. P30]PID10195.1 flagellar motor switch phosphatase FliY [Sporosarcina sp. P31]PID13772.1 flagellar motor switch phosphatase FliY [Sporosarcina sp. P32b]
MSDNILSQEEIEALLRGETLEPAQADEPEPETIDISDYLTEMEQDALGEVGNISFGSSATALSALLGQKVEITTPKLSLIQRDNLEDDFVHPYVAIKVEYTEGLSGVNLLVIKQSDAAIIADLMLGGDGTAPNQELSEIHLSAVQEAMNQMMGSSATSMSTIFNKKVDISPPTIDLMNIQIDQGTENIPAHNLLIRVSFNLKVGELIDSDIMQLFPLEFGKKLVSTLMGEEEAATMTEVPPSPPEPQYSEPEPAYTPDPAPMQQQQPVYQAPPMQQTAVPRQTQAPVHVQQAEFASFQAPTLNKEESNNLNLLLDIPLQVTVELGRTKRSVKEILEMSGGSIIELDKLAGEPVDILVNNRYIAKGEVVVIDENFGVRITDILSQMDRLNNLR